MLFLRLPILQVRAALRRGPDPRQRDHFVGCNRRRPALAAVGQRQRHLNRLAARQLIHRSGAHADLRPRLKRALRPVADELRGACPRHGAAEAGRALLRRAQQDVCGMRPAEIPVIRLWSKLRSALSLLRTRHVGRASRGHRYLVGARHGGLDGANDHAAGRRAGGRELTRA